MGFILLGRILKKKVKQTLRLSTDDPSLYSVIQCMMKSLQTHKASLACLSVRQIHSKNPPLCSYYLNDSCSIIQQSIHSLFFSWDFMPLVFRKIISDVDS